MTRGGARPGAGRKKGFSAIQAEKAREILIQAYMENIKPINEALMKKGEHAYGGKYWGVGGRWLWIWLSDYRESTVVKKSWQLEIGSWLMGNKIIYSK